MPGPDLVRPDRDELRDLAWSAVVTTALAFWLWYAAVERLGSGRAGLLTGLVPVGALATTCVLHLHGPAATALLGVLLAGAGITLGLRAPQVALTHHSQELSCPSR